VGIVAPDLWLKMLAEWDRLEESPNNSSALYRLADHISSATIWRWGDQTGINSTSLYKEGLETIKKAIRLNPGDVKNRELYLRYLRADESMLNFLRILAEVDIILELDPENDYVEPFGDYASRRVEGYQTATARALATATSTFTPVPTATPTLNTPTPTSERVEDSTPEIPPTPSDALEAEEGPYSIALISFGLIIFTIVVILLLRGGMAVNKATKRK
jgi:hypothetical protein